MPDNSLDNLLQKKSTLAVFFILAFALLGYASWDTYQRYKHIRSLKTEVSTAKQAVHNTRTIQKKTSDTRRIASQFLFGKRKQALPPPKVTTAPVTRLKLKLIGVIAANGSGNSRAIIKIDNKKTGVYAKGDQLPKSKAELYDIQAEQVMLKRNGKLERLSISRKVLKNKDGSLVNKPANGS